MSQGTTIYTKEKRDMLIEKLITAIQIVLPKIVRREIEKDTKQKITIKITNHHDN